LHLDQARLPTFEMLLIPEDQQDRVVASQSSLLLVERRAVDRFQWSGPEAKPFDNWRVLIEVRA
jgi:hypothetical protein